jgi:hypothetical protein
MHSTFGLTIGPPAESEYAVEPVGVETIKPSAFLKILIPLHPSDIHRLYDNLY